jgi:GT2 family glycosyltransferase
MAVRRSAVLEFGGFDDRIRPSAEDNDLSYRWLRTGRRIRYQPGFVVWHHDWRTREQLERLYIDYGIGKGMVYGLHLRRGDLMISRHLLIDLYAIARGVAARLILGHRDRIDARLGLLRGLPVGLARGWRSSRGSAPSSRS